jgi:hypothetical protein
LSSMMLRHSDTIKLTRCFGRKMGPRVAVRRCFDIDLKTSVLFLASMSVSGYLIGRLEEKLLITVSVEQGSCERSLSEEEE